MYHISALIVRVVEYIICNSKTERHSRVLEANSEDTLFSGDSSKSVCMNSTTITINRTFPKHLLVERLNMNTGTLLLSNLSSKMSSFQLCQLFNDAI